MACWAWGSRWHILALLLLAPLVTRAHEGYHNTLQEAYQSAAAQESAWSTFCVSSLQAGHVLVDFSITETSTAFVTNGRCLRSSDGSQVVMGPASHMWQPGQGCVAPEVYDPNSNTCLDWELECTSRPEVVEQWSVDGEPGQDLVCHQGCTYGSYFDPSTGQSYYSALDTGDGGAAFGHCEVGPETPEPTTCNASGCFPDADQDGVPDDTDAFPDDPTESTDSDGDGLGDNADHAPDDPTNGSDDGEGDESDNQSSGGGACGGAPPTCVGDGILCNVLWQNYNARCALERIEGHARGIEEGIGELVDAQGSNNGQNMDATNSLLGTLNGMVEDMKNWMHGIGDDEPVLSGMQMPEEELPVDEDWVSGLAENDTCPAPVETSVELLGTTVPIEFSFSPICDFAALLRPLILLLASIVSGYIIAGVRR